MKKTLIYLLILAALVGGVVYLFVLEKKPTEEQERSFAVKNIKDVTTITIKDRADRSIRLDKKDGKWVLNEKYKVKSSMLKELMKTITTMEVVAAVPKAAKENVLKQMISHSTKVSFYKNGKEKPFKTYIVGGPTHEQDGTYVLMEINGKAASTPYIAKVPGRRGYFTYHFTPVESEWRSLLFAKFMPKEIKEVQLNFADSAVKDQSFTLTQDKGKYTLVSPNETLQHEAINQTKAQNLLFAFSDLHYESFQDDYAHKDSIMTHFPFGTLRVSTQNETKELRIFKMPLREGDRRKIIDGVPNEFSLEGLYAFNPQTKDFTTIQIYTFKDILVKAEELKR